MILGQVRKKQVTVRDSTSEWQERDDVGEVSGSVKKI